MPLRKTKSRGRIRPKPKTTGTEAIVIIGPSRVGKEAGIVLLRTKTLRRGRTAK
jgi:hypothetical protein